MENYPGRLRYGGGGTDDGGNEIFLPFGICSSQTSRKGEILRQRTFSAFVIILSKRNVVKFKFGTGQRGTLLCKIQKRLLKGRV